MKPISKLTASNKQLGSGIKTKLLGCPLTVWKGLIKAMKISMKEY